MNIRVAIASDHAGFRLKSLVIEHLKSAAYQVDDVGPASPERCDYPDYASAVSQQVTEGNADYGVLVCGSGVGMSMAANKIRGIRAALAHNPMTARLSREHNDANVLCLGSRLIGEAVALESVDAFLAGRFQGGRHQDRIAKMVALEERR